MALPGTKEDRDYRNFFDPGGETTGRVVGLAGAFNAPPDTDAITTQYPNSLTEVYEFRSGGLTGAILLTITVTYTDVSKELIDTVVRS